MEIMIKHWWNKFTTIFAIPLLIFAQIVTLYDGWESRIEEREYQEELVRCVNQHFHYTQEDLMVTLPNGSKVSEAEFFDGLDETGVVYWEEESNCEMFSLQSPIREYTPERTMDRWLGKVFWTYKNTKDRLLEWIDYQFMRQATKDIRG